jgi:hypothetical protein
LAENNVVKLHKPFEWEIIDYATQIKDFFVKVRKLNGMSLNLKCDITIELINEGNIKRFLGK